MSMLSRKIAKRTELREKDVREVLDALEACIVEELSKNGSVSIPAIGTMSTQEQKPHYIRSVQTGKKVLTSSDSPRIRFEPYPSFRDKCK